MSDLYQQPSVVFPNQKESPLAEKEALARKKKTKIKFGIEEYGI